MTFSTALSPEDLELMDAQRLHAVITSPSNGMITRIAYDPNRLFMKHSNKQLFQELKGAKTQIKLLLEKINVFEEQQRNHCNHTPISTADSDAVLAQLAEKEKESEQTHRMLHAAQAKIAALSNRLLETQEELELERNVIPELNVRMKQLSMENSKLVEGKKCSDAKLQKLEGELSVMTEERNELRSELNLANAQLARDTQSFTDKLCHTEQKVDEYQAKLADTLKMLEVMSATNDNLQQEQEILHMQREDSLVTQCALFTKVRETECSPKVQCESHTELHDSDPPESLRKTQDVHGSPWGDDSEYSSGEIHVTALKDHRPIKSHSRPRKKTPADPGLVKMKAIEQVKANKTNIGKLEKEVFGKLEKEVEALLRKARNIELKRECLKRGV